MARCVSMDDDLSAATHHLDPPVKTSVHQYLHRKAYYETSCLPTARPSLHSIFVPSRNMPRLEISLSWRSKKFYAPRVYQRTIPKAPLEQVSRRSWLRMARSLRRRRSSRKASDRGGSGVDKAIVRRKREEGADYSNRVSKSAGYIGHRGPKMSRVPMSAPVGDRDGAEDSKGLTRSVSTSQAVDSTNSSPNQMANHRRPSHGAKDPKVRRPHM